MSIPILETSRKRKREDKIFGFRTFGNPGCPIDPSRKFCDDVETFLGEGAGLESYYVNGLPVWCTQLLFNDENRCFIVPLYTIKQGVSANHFECNHCISIGWGNQFDSKMIYHLIIPNDRGWNKPLGDDVLELQTHLLHGVIHCNGFGHLFCVNGIEGGSRYLLGREIMDLWDRICILLNAEKISLEDSSRKHSMDLRLLHGVAFGHSWFGKWGYRCSHESNYLRAIKILGSLELNKIIHDFGCTDRYVKIKKIIGFYRDWSDTKLITLGEVIKIMLSIKSRAPANPPASPSPGPSTRAPLNFKQFSDLITETACEWPTRRMEYAGQVVVDVLKGKGGLLRQELRDAALELISDTGLLDHVLKYMQDVIIGKHVVMINYHSNKRRYEYIIKEIGKGTLASDLTSQRLSNEFPEQSIIPGVDVYKDLLYLYNSLLLNYPDSGVVAAEIKAALNNKNFVKEYVERNSSCNIQ